MSCVLHDVCHVFGDSKLVEETKSAARPEEARGAFDLNSWLFFAEGLQGFEVVFGQTDVEASPIDN
jgi:hypothetical protein